MQMSRRHTCGASPVRYLASNGNLVVAATIATFFTRAIASQAFAEPAPTAPPRAAALPSGPPTSVVGGNRAEAGKWPDVAAVYSGSALRCTGVLVAPTVVLSAAHCNVPAPDKVLIGAETLAAGNQGEVRSVARAIEYPGWESTMDVLVMVLSTPSTKAPRTIASGWARFEIDNGSKVAIVGFGAIDADGTQYVDPLQEATTTIADAGCEHASGCNADARPDGELAAGGKGIDSCSGDSGGPLYVLSPRGTFLAGLTSRAYDDARKSCSEGGIYTRPEKVLDWIEAQAGVPVRRGPEPAVDRLEVTVGQGAEVVIAANDPKTQRHHYKIVTPPTRGTAAVNNEGRVRVCGASAGEDSLVVDIADASTATRHLTVTVPIQVADGVDDGRCKAEFSDDSGGCQAGNRGASWLVLLAAVSLWCGSQGRARRRTPPTPGVPAGT
jgi:secreted trypsin-like serine protease